MADPDYWNAQEIDQLKDDLESALTDVVVQESKADKWYEAYERKNKQYNSLQRTMDSRIEDANRELVDKSMIYLSLINEYEKVLSVYESNSPVTLTTSTINNLRKRGGLIA